MNTGPPEQASELHPAPTTTAEGPGATAGSVSTPGSTEEVSLKRPSPMRRVIAPLLRVAVAAALLGFVLYQADLAALASHLAGTAWGIYALGVALMIAAQGLLVVNLRWAVARLGGNMPLRPAAHAHAVGLAANLVLPTSVGGDAVKTLLVRKRMRGYLDAAAAVVLTRAAGMPGMLLNGGLGVALTFSALAAAGLAVPASLVVGLLLLGLLLAWLARRRLSRWMRRRAPQRLRDKLTPLLDAVEAMSLRELAPLMLLGWLYSLCGVAWYALFAYALGLPLSVPEVMTAIVLVYLLILLPVSIQGIGVRELGYILFFGAYGVAVEPAVAFSLLAYLAVLLNATAAILYTLLVRAERASGE